MHTNKINNKKYIGITCRKKPEWRWGKHGQKYNDTQYFWNAIQKYGWENFEHEILLTKLTEEEAKQKEKELIKKYKTTNRKLGYNISAGGDDMSHLRGKNHPFYGKHFTEEHRKNLSEASKNRVRSPEEIKMNTQKLFDYMATHENAFKGKHHTTEFKKNQSKKVTEYWATHKHPQKGKIRTEASKNKIAKSRNDKGLAYSVICAENGKIYVSLRQASEDTGISRSSISDCCNGKRESVKGFHFKYLNKNNKINYNGQKKKVVCLETNKIYESLSEAGRDLKIDKNSIWKCCQKNYKMARGFHFKYYDEEENKK